MKRNDCRFSLSDDEVRFIRSMKGVVTQASLAKQFGCSQVQVSMIMRGLSRKDVPQEIEPSHYFPRLTLDDCDTI